MTPRSTVSRQEWLERRRLLPQQEKQLTCVHDEVARARRALPWVRVDEPYRFEGPHGTCTLRDLFAGRGQLLVHHFMFDPEWTAGCLVCSFWADSFDGIGAHLAVRGATLVAVSRAPYAALARYRQRMGWRFDWYASADRTFNFDYGVSFYTRAGRVRGRLQRPAHASARRTARDQRVCAGAGRRRLAHLFGVFARARCAQHRLSAPRPVAARPRGVGTALAHGLGAPARRIRTRVTPCIPDNKRRCHRH